MSMKKQKYKNDCLILRTIDELVPQDELVRLMDDCMDFTFIEDKVKDLYSNVGIDSISLVVFLKILILNKVDGINSIRKTYYKCRVNLAYRWFLGLSFEDEIPNYSTWSQNYIRIFKDSDIFDEIFKEILKQAMDYNFIDTTAVFYDRTHQKVNKKKCTNEEVEIIVQEYKREILEEINEIRKEYGQKE